MTLSWRRVLVASAIVLLIGVIGACVLMPESGFGETKAHTASVIWVMDGDTLVLRFPKDANEAVARLIAADPRGWPVDPERTDEYVANLIAVDAAGWQEEGGDCYALEAAAHLQSLLLGKQVEVTWDSKDKIGRRGRILVYVAVEGKDVNAEVIRNGYGWVPRRFPADRKDVYLKLEEAARQSGQGLWGACGQQYISAIPAVVGSSPSP